MNQCCNSFTWLAYFRQYTHACTHTLWVSCSLYAKLKANHLGERGINLLVALSAQRWINTFCFKFLFVQFILNFYFFIFFTSVVYFQCFYDVLRRNKRILIFVDKLPHGTSTHTQTDYPCCFVGGWWSCITVSCPRGLCCLCLLVELWFPRGSSCIVFNIWCLLCRLSLSYSSLCLYFSLHHQFPLPLPPSTS